MNYGLGNQVIVSSNRCTSSSKGYSPSALTLKPLRLMGNTIGGFSKSNKLIFRSWSVL